MSGEKSQVRRRGSPWKWTRSWSLYDRVSVGLESWHWGETRKKWGLTSNEQSAAGLPWFGMVQIWPLCQGRGSQRWCGWSQQESTEGPLGPTECTVLFSCSSWWSCKGGTSYLGEPKSSHPFLPLLRYTKSKHISDTGRSREKGLAEEWLLWLTGASLLF